MSSSPTSLLSEDVLRQKENRYCSQGSFLFDREDRPFLDLQMWYSAVNFGYKNKAISDAVRAQLEQLPQLACQYLHEEKVLAAEKLAGECARAFGAEGRVHFNVGGAQAIRDSMKLVRNATGKSLFMTFMGGYHGRTLGAYVTRGLARHS